MARLALVAGAGVGATVTVGAGCPAGQIRLDARGQGPLVGDHFGLDRGQGVITAGRIHQGHFMRVRPEEERFLTADLLQELTFTGTPAELAGARPLDDAGYEQIAVSLVPGHESALEDWARVLEKA